MKNTLLFVLLFCLIGCDVAAAQDWNVRNINRVPDVGNLDMTDTIKWYAQESVRYSVFPRRGGKPMPIAPATSASWIVTDDSETIWISAYGSVSSNSVEFNLAAGQAALPEDGEYTSYVALLNGDTVIGVIDRAFVQVLWQPGTGVEPIVPPTNSWPSLVELVHVAIADSVANLTAEMDAHIQDMDNPHQVTPEQIGAATPEDVEAARLNAVDPQAREDLRNPDVLAETLGGVGISVAQGDGVYEIDGLTMNVELETGTVTFKSGEGYVYGTTHFDSRPTLGGIGLATTNDLLPLYDSRESLSDRITTNTADIAALNESTTAEFESVRDDMASADAALAADIQRTENDIEYIRDEILRIGTAGLKYELSGDEWWVARYTGSETYVIVPATYEGRVVRGIRWDATGFENIRQLHSYAEVIELGYSGSWTNDNWGQIQQFPGRGKSFSFMRSAFTGNTNLMEVWLYTATALGDIADTEGTQGYDPAGLDVAQLGGAFSSCTALTNVVADNLLYIGFQSFEGCTALKNTAFKNVKILGKRAFAKSGVTNVVMKRLEIIGTSAFRACAGLRDVRLPAKHIGAYAFSECKNLRWVWLDEAATVKRGAFHNAIIQTSLSLAKAEDISKIQAFVPKLTLGVKLLKTDKIQLTQLVRLELPNMEEAEARALYGAPHLTHVDAKKARRVESGFLHNATNLGYVQANALEYIGGNAFRNTRIGNTTFHAAKDIGQGAFRGITNMTHMSLKNAVHIRRNAFGASGHTGEDGQKHVASNLQTLDAPNVEIIEGGAFASCTNLHTGYTPNLQILGGRVFMDTGLKWSTKDHISGEMRPYSARALQYAGDYAFWGTALESIYLSALHRIGRRGVFGNNPYLEYVWAPGLFDVYETTFTNCPSLEPSNIITHADAGLTDKDVVALLEKYGILVAYDFPEEGVARIEGWGNSLNFEEQLWTGTDGFNLDFLPKIKGADAATVADVSTVATNLSIHIADTNNPHQITPGKIGALPIEDPVVPGNLDVRGNLFVEGSMAEGLGQIVATTIIAWESAVIQGVLQSRGPADFWGDISIRSNLTISGIGYIGTNLIATVADIEAAVSNFVPIGTNYATTNWVADYHSTHTPDLSAYTPLSTHSTATNALWSSIGAVSNAIPSTNGLASTNWVTEYHADHTPDLSGYALTTDLLNYTPLTTYNATISSIWQSIGAVSNSIPSTNGLASTNWVINYHAANPPNMSSYTLLSMHSAATNSLWQSMAAISNSVPSTNGLASMSWVANYHDANAPDLAPYALTTDLLNYTPLSTYNAAVSSLWMAVGAISNAIPDSSNYATTNWVVNYHAANPPDLSAYATRAQMTMVSNMIPSTNGLASTNWVTQYHNNNPPDLSAYATTQQLYTTYAGLDARIAALEAGSTNVPPINPTNPPVYTQGTDPANATSFPTPGTTFTFYSDTQKTLVNTGTVNSNGLVVPSGGNGLIVWAYTDNALMYVDAKTLIPFAGQFVSGASALVTNWTAGHIRQGSNYFMAFIDENANGVWDYGELIGFSEYMPENIGYGDSQVRIILSTDKSGFLRDSWEEPGVPYRVQLIWNSESGQPQIYDQTREAYSRNNLHEWDFINTNITRMLGTYTRRIWVGTNNISEVMKTVSGATELSPAQVIAPDGTLVYGRNRIKLGLDSNTSWLNVSIRNPSVGTTIWSNKMLAPVVDRLGFAEFDLPLIAGTAPLTNGTYELSAIASSAQVTNIVATGTFFVNLLPPPAGAGAITGNYQHFAAATNSLVIEAFTGSGFDQEPMGRQIIPTTSQNGAFTIMGLRTGTYYIRGFVDLNNNGRLDAGEPWGMCKNANADGYSTYPLQVTDRQLTTVPNDLFIYWVTGDVNPYVNAAGIEPYADVDIDALPDGWETQYPAVFSLFYNEAYDDPDGDGWDNISEYLGRQ